MYLILWETLITFVGIVRVILANSHDIIITPVSPIESEPGGSAFLSCKLTSTSPPNFAIKWFDKNGNEITRTTPGTEESAIWVNVNGVETELFIKGIGTQHAGIYTCKLLVNNTVEKELTNEIKLKEVLKFKDVPGRQVFAIGPDALVKCEPADEITTPVTWKKNDVIISGGEKYSMIRLGLVIKDASAEDSGRYTCELKIGASFDSKDIEVIVRVQLDMIIGLNDTMEGIEGADFSFSCQATGGLTHMYKFYLNDTLLVNDSRVIIDTENGRLFFSPLSREDEGTYTCSVEDEAQTQTSSGYLTVLIPPSILSFPNVTVEENQEFTILCLFEGNPTPSVVITKTESSLRIEDNKLQISEASVINHGVYVCEVYSELGRDLQEAEVNVLFKPKASPDQLYKWFSFALFIKNITCFVTANPPPSFVWYFNGIELTENNSTFTVFNGEYESYLQLFIQVRDQAWIYYKRGVRSKFTCKATNQIGSTEIVLDFERATNPDKLYNLTYQIYPCQVDFNYSLPDDTGGEEVLGLVAYINDTPRDMPLKNRIRINKLEPETFYILKMSCRTIVGTGDAVDEFEVTTISPSKPYPVEILSAVNTTKTAECKSGVIEIDDFSVCVEWDEPIDVCHPIESFRIRYRPVTYDPDTETIDPLADWFTRSSYNGSELSIKLEKLKPNMTYEFEIFAKNVLGESDTSRIIFKTHSDMSLNATQEEDEEEESSSNLVLILIIIFSVIVFLIIVDLSCFFAKDWGVISSLKNLSNSNNNSFAKKFNESQKLRAEIKFDARSLQHQEEFAALTPTEAPSDYQRTVFSASTSQITTSSNEIDTFHENERYTEDENARNF